MVNRGIMHRVSLVLLGTVAFSVVSAGIASAADLPPRPSPLPPPAIAPVVVVPVFTWSGCFIGAHGGYGFGTKKFTNVQGVDFTDHDINGGLAGGQVGCNIQTGVFVFGVEGDASWAGLKGDSPVDDVSTSPGSQSGKYHTKVDALGTIAAKFGFAVDRALLYGKVGGAFALDKH
jgi:outer membrane immunogenic protein